MTRANFENLRIYQLAEKLSDNIWQSVGRWDNFAKDTVGKQLVRAADSIGANIAEGSGRGSSTDYRRSQNVPRIVVRDAALAPESLYAQATNDRTNQGAADDYQRTVSEFERIFGFSFEICSQVASNTKGLRPKT
jgi:hypothetical protein